MGSFFVPVHSRPPSSRIGQLQFQDSESESLGIGDSRIPGFYVPAIPSFQISKILGFKSLQSLILGWMDPKLRAR